MRLQRAHIEGFGKLVDRQFEFGPGLNLVYGENEAGKTTLLQALVALLFGPPGTGGRLPEKELATYRPWGGTRFGGELAIELDDGRCYTIRWRFGRKSHFTLTLPEGTQTADPQALSELTGVTGSLFASSALINHNAILRLARPGELAEAIRRSLDVNEPEIPTEPAAERLLRARQQIGEPTDVQTLWGGLEVEIDDLKEERRALARQRHQLMTTLARQCRLEERLHNYRTRLAEVEFALASRRHQEASDRLAEIQEIQERLEKYRVELVNCERFASVPENGRGVAISAYETLCEAKQQVADLTRQREELENTIGKLRSQLDELQAYSYLCQPGEYDYFAESCAAWFAAQKRLQDFADAARNYEQRMRERGLSAQQLQALSKFSETEFKSLQGREKSFQEWHRRLSELQEDVLRLRSRHPFPGNVKVTLAVSTAFFSTINFLVWYLHHLSWGLVVGASSILGVGLLSALLLARQTRHHRRLRRLEEELAAVHQRAYELDREILAALEVYGAQSLTDLLAKRIEYLEAGHTFREVQMATEDQQRLGARLLRLLEPLGIDHIEAARLTEVSDRVEAMRRLREELKRSLDQRDQIRRRLLAVELEVRRSETTLHRALETAGIVYDPELDLPAVLEEIYAKRDRYTHLRQEIANQEKLLAGLLAGRTAEDWGKVAARLERRVETLRRAVPGDSAQSEASPGKLDRRAERLRQLISRIEAELAATRERARGGSEQLQRLAETDEALAWLRHRATSLRRWAAALDLAHRELLAAAEEQHRDFAPRLAASVSKHLHRLTDGRYSRAVLDPRDFSLGLEIPDLGLQPAERMSLATREQLYLLLRLAIADTLTLQGETLPLLLDDPFVHFDARRLHRMLDFLLSLAESRQVILFTKDDESRTWLQHHSTSDRYRQIDLPVTPS